MDDLFTDVLAGRIADAAADLIRQEEVALLEALGAPIFAQLMVDLQMNPLGIERWEYRDELQAWSGETLRIESRVSFMQTRPMPRHLV